MEFLGVGLPELLVILVIMLIVVGPQRLPEMAAQMARAIREFRRYTANLSRDVTEALEDIEKEYKDARDEWKEVGEAVRQDMKAIDSEMRGAADDVRNVLKEAKQPTGDETPSTPPSKVVSMEDAAGRRARPDAGREPEGSPPSTAGESGSGEQRPAGRGGS